jgi:hypothetical protein
MSVLEEIAVQKQTGKIGCDSCIFWQEYGPMNIALYGLVGKWGRCSSVQQVKDINNKYIIKKLWMVDRLNTNLTRLSVDTIVLATTPTYTCPHVKIPDERQNKESTDDIKGT